MNDLKELVIEARNGDLKAFSEIVRRFQDMALGYAYSFLGDFYLAEDATQEAFLDMFRQIRNLRNPEAFFRIASSNNFQTLRQDYTKTKTANCRY